MRLADLIKAGAHQTVATATPATSATDEPQYSSSVAIVATVAVARSQKQAANDPGEMMVTAKVTGKTAVPGDRSFPTIPTESVKVFDPDSRFCPNSTAMTGREISTYAIRLSGFLGRGLDDFMAEKLADILMVRDREKDDRRLCLECRHLSGYGQASWRCGNWQTAGVAIRSRDAQVPAVLVVQLQRCNGFAAKEASKSWSESEVT